MPQVPLQIQAREQVALKIQSRQEQGKGPVGQMRRLQGQLPGVIYGHNRPSESFKTGCPWLGAHPEQGRAKRDHLG